VVSTIYEIPVGRNRKFLPNANRPLDAVVGGWQLQGIYTFQTGSPLSWPDVTMWTDGSDVALSDRNPERWFNTSAFLTTSTLQPQNHLRTFPFRLSSVRADGINKWDLSAIKKFRIVERLSVPFRAEALNALNHTRFAAPTMDAYSSSFGRVSATQDYARQIQLSVKAVF
jgi:hypothetical protein